MSLLCLQIKLNTLYYICKRAVYKIKIVECSIGESFYSDGRVPEYAVHNSGKGRSNMLDDEVML